MDVLAETPVTLGQSEKECLLAMNIVVIGSHGQRRIFDMKQILLLIAGMALAECGKGGETMRLETPQCT